MMVLLSESAARLVRMVRKRRRRMPPTEVSLLSKGWRGAEQLVVWKVDEYGSRRNRRSDILGQVVPCINKLVWDRGQRYLCW